ncbi:MAG: (2Fe-2S)-binding protein [Cyanobacterium sp. T60_A2020_053]|nr:(2Fe-2S)-binding protein [Cyanobacterium sp. T60_A2020_053]
MYVCICNAVTEKDIHKAVREGISSLDQLSQATSVSLRCGSCQSRACQVLESALSNLK